MNSILYFILRSIRKTVGNNSNKYALKYYKYVDLYDQDANDYILQLISQNCVSGLMISKFGTVELSNIIAARYNKLNNWNKEYFKDFLNYNVSFDLHYTLKSLCSNAGFFPYNP